MSRPTAGRTPGARTGQGAMASGEDGATGRRDAGAGGSLAHHACVYGTDEEFLATAVPFVAGGLERGEPVLVSSTAANLELLRSALGARAGEFDFAEALYFGRNPAQRTAALHRWWQRQTARPGVPPGTRARILAEPVLAGQSPAQVAAWQRLESGVNHIFASVPIQMLCPYDTRVVPAAAMAARQTHPTLVRGLDVQTCAEFTDPVAFARARDDASPLPATPPGIPALRFALAGEIAAVRRFVADRATAHGLHGERARLLVAAAGEVATYLVRQGAGGGVIRVWAVPGRVACDVAATGRLPADPFLGYRPPTLEPQPGDGLWLTRQICEAVHIRSTPEGCHIRLEVHGPRAMEP